MGRMGQEESDFKTQLVLNICSISTRYVVCVHRLLSNPANPPPFIDWYHILGVEENAGSNTIRKRYHKLALQLHPDKNKHPKAEIAFKLVSEAYACLSDAEKRKAFELERWKNFCFECKKIPYSSSTGVPRNNSNGGSGFKVWNIISRSRSYKLWKNLKEIRERFKEEARVIENCLRVNSMSRKESPVFNPVDYLDRSKSQHRSDRETPVFNPSNYLYQGYPHLRGQIFKNSDKLWYLRNENSIVNDRGGATYDSPVFEVRPERRMFTNKFAYVPS